MRTSFYRLSLALIFSIFAISELAAQESAADTKEISVDLLGVRNNSLSVLYKKFTPSGQSWRYGTTLFCAGNQSFSSPGVSSYFNIGAAGAWIGLQSKIKNNKINFYKGINLGINYKITSTFYTSVNIITNKDNATYSGSGTYRYLVHTLSMGIRPFAGINIPLTKTLALNVEAGLPVSIDKNIESVKHVGVLTNLQYPYDQWDYNNKVVSSSGLLLPFSGPSLALWLSLKL